MTLSELTKAIAGARERANLIGSDADASKVSGAEYMSAAYQRVWEDRKALLAVIDQLLPDARRYRHVRDNGVPELCIVINGVPNYVGRSEADAARITDETIDRAIEGER